MQLANEIPEPSRESTAAALEWLNESREETFELTGLVDYEAALSRSAAESFELGLVLCSGDICDRVQVCITPQAQGYRFNLVDESPRTIPPLLDPPEGVRRSWLDDVLGKHEFVLLLFYRGLW